MKLFFQICTSVSRRIVFDIVKNIQQTFFDQDPPASRLKKELQVYLLLLAILNRYQDSIVTAQR